MDPLTALDETLNHQTPATFYHVAPSDHRFFDRHWLQFVDPKGEAGVISGMANYANNNARDGFASAYFDGKQYNQRFSRQLRPEVNGLALGGLEYEIVKPLQTLRLILRPGDYPVSFDVTWDANAPVVLEHHHFARVDGRITQDYERYDQSATVNGWLQVGDTRIEVRDWWGARDHSWGVRPGVGGWDPTTGSDQQRSRSLFIWLLFTTDDAYGYMQLQEDPQGRRTLLDGFVADGRGPEVERIEVVDVQHEMDFYPGTRAYRRAQLHMTTADGKTWDIVAEPTFTAWAYAGTGYDRGYNDKLGLGAYRGQYLEEADVYDVSHPEAVLMDGKPTPSGHREQPARITLNGRPGMAHLPVMLVGTHHRYSQPAVAAAAR